MRWLNRIRFTYHNHRNVSGIPRSWQYEICLQRRISGRSVSSVSSVSSYSALCLLAAPAYERSLFLETYAIYYRSQNCIVESIKHRLCEMCRNTGHANKISQFKCHCKLELSNVRK